MSAGPIVAFEALEDALMRVTALMSILEVDPDSVSAEAALNRQITALVQAYAELVVAGDVFAEIKNFLVADHEIKGFISNIDGRAQG
jgi:tRNA A37 threonylcarbamoyladenosine dehydratase